MRPEGLLAQPGSLGSLGCAHVFIGFIRVRWVHSCAPSGSLGSFRWALGVVGYFLGCWVHSGAPWVSLSSSGVIEFTRVRPGDQWVHPGSLGSLRCVPA